MWHPMMEEEEPCKCPISANELPQVIQEAAVEDRHEEIIKWLEQGGDVNATRSGWSILSTACQYGHQDLIRILIEENRLHLNNKTGGLAPLYLASIYGHTGCVKHLLNAQLKCRLDISANNGLSPDESTTALLAAASFDHWEVVEVILPVYRKLDERELKYILDRAISEDKWGILWILIQRNYDFDKEKLKEVLARACKEEKWDLVSAILNKGICLRNLNISDMLSSRVSNRDWITVGALLKVLSSQVVLNSTLAEAILQEGNEITEQFLEEENTYIVVQERTVEDLLNQDEYKEGNLDAALLVAAVGGTTEPVAHLLLNRHHSSNKTVVINTLLLASKYNRLELLPDLLEHHEDVYSYKILSQARQIAAKEQHMDAVRLLFRALEIKGKKLLS